MDRSLAVIVLAAGVGSRMKSSQPKVLHRVAGLPMLAHVLRTVGAMTPARIVGVVAPGQDAVAAVFAPHPTAAQARPRGTADAARAGLARLGAFRGDVLVIYGDTPLVTPPTLRSLLRSRRGRNKGRRFGVAVLGFDAPDPTPYGRLVLEGGELVRIVESRDAKGAERDISLCNSGVMAIDGELLPGLLAKITNKNAKREFYLTDLVGLARQAGHACTWARGPQDELVGINSRAELAAAEAVMQARLRAAAMNSGVTLLDPQSVWLAADTRFGRDVTIGPSVLFGPGVRIGDRVEIKGFCHIEGADIGADAIVGPFARLRPGTRLAREVHIGNFVEVKNSSIGAGSKANHHAYLGDGEVGARSNIGAGTIFVNYDGFGKYRTRVGDDSFVGSNSSLVAPVTVGKGAYVPAGSVIVSDVPAESLTFGRARQVDKPGRAPALRRQLAKRAAAAKRKKQE
jgi:bifunctional UDP-N-acetylglucosamine pyrophosphorylase/glucosamine-1-phosphate N-acetyltransferase